MTLLRTLRDALSPRLRDDSGQSTIMSLTEAAVLAVVLGGGLVSGVATATTAALVSAENDVHETQLLAFASTWQTTPYPQLRPTSSGSATEGTGAATTPIVYSVTKDSTGGYQLVAGTPRAHMGPIIPAPGSCNGLVNGAPRSDSLALDCLVVHRTVSADLNVVPPTPAGLTLATKTAPVGLELGTFDQASLLSNGATDLRISLHPASVSAAQLSTWRVSETCSATSLLGAPAPTKTTVTPNTGGWISARLTVPQLPCARPTIVLWSDGGTDPKASDLTDRVYAWRVADGSQ